MMLCDFVLPRQRVLTENHRGKGIRHLRRLVESSSRKTEGQGQGGEEGAGDGVSAASHEGTGSAAQNGSAPRKAAKDLGRVEAAIALCGGRPKRSLGAPSRETPSPSMLIKSPDVGNEKDHSTAGLEQRKADSAGVRDWVKDALEGGI